MKKIIILILSLISIISCDKIDKLTQFDLDMETQVTIPSGLPINTPFDIPTPPIPTQSSQVFENNNTSKDLIEQAKLKKMKLSIISPATGNFDFIKDIEIYISADGLPEKKIAWIYDHPNDRQNILNLETTTIDLKDYVKKDEISIRIKTVTDEILTQDYEIKVEYTFFIDAEILGI